MLASVRREVLIFLAIALLSGAFFYASFIYPPFPKPVKFAKPGVTRLDMSPSDSELVPDFVTGAIYQRSEIEEVNRKRGKISGAAILIFLTYPEYLFIKLIIWAIKRARKRRALLGFLFAICLAFTQGAHAAPSNGTVFPPQGRIEVGYEYHIMFERELYRSFGTTKTVNHFSSFSVGMTDWLAIDGKLGWGDLTLARSAHLPRLEFGTAFAGGYGFRIKAFDDDKTGTRLVLGAQHTCVHPQDETRDENDYESILDDWQISGLLAKRFSFLTPYVGIKASDSELIYKINKHDKKRRYSENHIGFIFGFDSHFLEDRFRFNTEARFFDETAFSTMIAYLF